MELVALWRRATRIRGYRLPIVLPLQEAQEALRASKSPFTGKPVEMIPLSVTFLSPSCPPCVTTPTPCATHRLPRCQLLSALFFLFGDAKPLPEQARANLHLGCGDHSHLSSFSQLRITLPSFEPGQGRTSTPSASSLSEDLLLWKEI